MHSKNKDSLTKTLYSFASDIENMKQILLFMPDSDEARRALAMVKFDILDAIHKISWIGCDKDAAIRNDVDEVVSDNPSVE